MDLQTDTMNTKAFSNLRTSDTRNYTYRIDASIKKKLENKQRVDAVFTEHMAKQYDIEKQLIDAEIKKQQKLIHRRMSFLKQRLEECRERHQEKEKKQQEWEEKKQLEEEKMAREKEVRKQNALNANKTLNDKTFVTKSFTAKYQKDNKQEEKAASTGNEEINKEKCKKMEYHFEAIDSRVPLSDPFAICSVRRHRRTTDQETGKFLLRALTDLEKIGEKHHEAYIENSKKLRKLEQQIGLRLDKKLSETVKREPWWMLRPGTPGGRPGTSASSFAHQLALKEKEVNRTLIKLRRSDPEVTLVHVKPGNRSDIVPIRTKTLSMPEISINEQRTVLGTPRFGDRGKTDPALRERPSRKVTFLDELNNDHTVIANKDDIISQRKSMMKSRELDKAADCRERIDRFIRRENPSAPLPPPKPKPFQKKEGQFLPRINMHMMTGDKFREVEHNPFMVGIKLPKISRSRDLLEVSTKEGDKMWSWLGFESEEEFTAALKGIKVAKKNVRRQSLTVHTNGYLAEFEKAGIDLKHLEKLAHLEAMLPDGFNDLDLESDDESEEEEEEEETEDARFTLFDTKIIKKSQTKSTQKKAPSNSVNDKNNSADNGDKKDTDADKKNHLKSPLPVTNFKMLSPDQDNTNAGAIH